MSRAPICNGIRKLAKVPLNPPVIDKLRRVEQNESVSVLDQRKISKIREKIGLHDS